MSRSQIGPPADAAAQPARSRTIAGPGGVFTFSGELAGKRRKTGEARAASAQIECRNGEGCSWTQ